MQLSATNTTKSILVILVPILFSVISGTWLLSDKFSNIEIKIDKYQSSCELRDSLKSRDISEIKYTLTKKCDIINGQQH